MPLATYLLRWNSALSRAFDLLTIELCMKRLDYGLNILTLRIREWQNIHKGDVVYVVREGEGATGIVLRGIIMQDPFVHKDWCTEDSPSRLITVRVTQIMHPNRVRLPDISSLEERWNKEEWRGCQYLTLIDNDTANELDNLFKSYLKDNAEQFAVNKNNGVAITSFEIG